MLYSELNQKHSCYDLDLYRKYSALYEGGQCFHKNIDLFLQKHPLEAPELWMARKRDISYKSFITHIINSFSSQLFTQNFNVKLAPERDKEFYTLFRQDVDRKGTDLSDFTRQVFTSALIHGFSWVLIEMPNPEIDRSSLSKQQYTDLDLGRATLCNIKPESVFDYQTDDYGNLEWIILHSVTCKRPSPKDKRKMITETWKIYDSINVSVYEISYDAEKPLREDTFIPEKIVYPHGFGQVPLLHFCLPEGMWIMNVCADAQIEHFRLSSGLNWALKNSCNPIGIFHCENTQGPEGENGPIALSNRTLKHQGPFLLMGVDEKMEWVQPETNSFDVLQKRLDTLEKDIYAISNQMALASAANSAAGVQRSGESKAQDRSLSEIVLHAYAAKVREFIQLVYEVVGAARGEDFVVSIDGFDKFADETMIDFISLVPPTNILSETFQKELQTKAANFYLPGLPVEIKDKIRMEIEQSSMEEKEQEKQPETTEESGPESGKSPNISAS